MGQIRMDMSGMKDGGSGAEVQKVPAQHTHGDTVRSKASTTQEVSLMIGGA